ncbi:NAD(P)-binding protein [Aspergillus saccharolyticus JOP 1030-1]|uniref:NAD(P)-binding protein n=1 Tax=Aspergillus saccharolyticus JOP 1030-1 TaxID=1450539 RepID=A0A318Z9N2_9EURO|nr:NAD(P)-binding protein [Aspergillus saccharolyticus JOP 1030-1]PYH43064.1 NAD(P)-binding protein [Aspergillus saccharolyticus JOP 1030-1]
MSRKLCITAVDGHTGFLIAELIMTDDNFKNAIGSVIGLTLHPEAPSCKELSNLGVKIVPHKPGRLREMTKTLQETGADAMCLIPPPHPDKFDITSELIEATKQAGVANVCMISSAGCDLAERDKQPRLREFIDLEVLFLAAKGDPNTSTGHSPVVIRPGFYAENLLLYSRQAQEEGLLPLPVGKDHKFAPIALGDVAQVAAHVLTGEGKHGFSDKHRGQLMVLTGPMLTTGDELASAASQALGEELKFENISEAEAKKVLQAQSESDQSEVQYLLEYYSLVREGKTNYISTTAFHDVTGGHPQEPPDFFKVYAQEFHRKRTNKRRKTSGSK